MQEDEIARLMGYTLPAIERIRSAELAQDDGFEDEKESDKAGGYDFS